MVGWGEAFSRNEDVALKQLIDTRILPLVLGRDATPDRQTKFSLEFNLQNFGRVGSIMYGISAVDIALWDILGKRAGQPLVNLLGGAFADKVTVYASLMATATWRRRDGVTPGHRPRLQVHQAARSRRAGDPRRLRGRRQGRCVMLDTNCPWSVEEALRYDRELADLDLYWLEEPIWPPENYRRPRHRAAHRPASHRRRRERRQPVRLQVAMIDAGAIDIAQPDVAKTGGVTELVKIAALCEAHGLEFVPHCALFGPGQIATIHLTAAHRRAPLFERLFWTSKRSSLARPACQRTAALWCRRGLAWGSSRMPTSSSAIA